MNEKLLIMTLITQAYIISGAKFSGKEAMVDSAENIANILIEKSKKVAEKEK